MLQNRVRDDFRGSTFAHSGAGRMSLGDVIAGGAIASATSFVLFRGQVVVSRRVAITEAIVAIERSARLILQHVDALVEHRRLLRLGRPEGERAVQTAAEADAALNDAFDARARLLASIDFGAGKRAHGVFRALDAVLAQARDGDESDSSTLERLITEVHNARSELLAGRWFRRPRCRSTRMLKLIREDQVRTKPQR